MNTKQPNLDQELEDFIRWLAIMPQHLKAYYSTPAAIQKTARLSRAACDWLDEVGVQFVVREARKTLTSIVEAPENLERSEFTRDRSIGGYGGVVVKKDEESAP